MLKEDKSTVSRLLPQVQSIIHVRYAAVYISFSGTLNPQGKKTVVTKGGHVFFFKHLILPCCIGEKCLR